MDCADGRYVTTMQKNEVAWAGQVPRGFGKDRVCRILHNNNAMLMCTVYGTAWDAICMAVLVQCACRRDFHEKKY